MDTETRALIEAIAVAVGVLLVVLAACFGIILFVGANMPTITF